jgi:hypothetical protein
MKGRTQVKRQDGSKWKDLDALTIYSAVSEAASTAAPVVVPAVAPSSAPAH